MRQWLADLLDPELPGMDETSLRARPAAVAAMVAVLVVLALLRYFGGILDTAASQGPTVLLGLAGCLGILVLAHGVEAVRAVDRRTWWFLGVGIGAYFLFWYVGRSDAFDHLSRPIFEPFSTSSRLAAWAYFCVNNFLLLLAPAMMFAWLYDRTGPGDLGLLHADANGVERAVRPLWPVYALAFAVVLPFVVQAATTELFVDRYPLYSKVIGGDNTLGLGELLLCEGLYMLSFVFLEGFFRGYLIFGTERGLGIYCLLFMSVPYVAGHFGKPMPEAMGAILAGTALGWLALKHRSVWLGAGLHVAIALVMDVMALWGRGVQVG